MKPLKRCPYLVNHFLALYELTILSKMFFHSPLHVVLFGATTGALGLSVLFTQVNGLTAALG